MAVTAKELRTAPRARYVLPLAVLVVPGITYAFLTEYIFAAMTPSVGLQLKFLSGLNNAEAAPSLAVLGADLKARYAFGLATSAFSVCALVALFLAIWRLAERWGRPLATAALAGCLLAGVAFASLAIHPLRALVSESALQQVGNLNAQHLNDIAGQIVGLVTLSEAVGVAAIVVLVLRFADIAFEPTPKNITEDSLRRRVVAFRNTLIISGLLLALSVASAHAFYHYPVSLLTPEAANEFKTLASTAAGFFGAMYSGILLVTAMPSYLAVSSDAAVLADTKTDRSHASREEWMETEGLKLAPRQAFTSLLAMAAPLLTGPALDLVNALAT